MPHGHPQVVRAGRIVFGQVVDRNAGRVGEILRARRLLAVGVVEGQPVAVAGNQQDSEQRGRQEHPAGQDDGRGSTDGRKRHGGFPRLHGENGRPSYNMSRSAAMRALGKPQACLFSAVDNGGGLNAMWHDLGLV